MEVASFDLSKCDACGKCLEACEEGALSLYNMELVDQDLCTGCGECAEICNEEALVMLPSKFTFP